MNILLIGSGGRENALAYKLDQSASLDKLFISPGNPGTEIYGTNVLINDDNKAYLDFCKKENIDLVIIGPEKPLVNGLGNYLRKNNINVFGPDSEAARIESSKSYSKKLMQKYHIPTALYREFNSEDVLSAKDYLIDSKYPLVIKADGLAAGKGVFICQNSAYALEVLDDIFNSHIFGHSGDKVIIEEFMEGEEASLLIITDGVKYLSLPAAQDHKRIGDNDTGKNTGGMGAYAPAPLITSELLSKIEKEIISPVLKGLASEGNKFIGCLYAGLMLTKQGPKVVEFNCRFGDPETQVVLPLLDGDLAKLLYSAAIGNLDKSSVKYNGGSSVCVVAASVGYPDKYQYGFEISGLDKINDNILIFHAGTNKQGNKLFSKGGRVLGITSVLKENDLINARDEAYHAIENIHYENMYFRKDICAKGIKYLTQKKDINCS